MSHYTTAQSDLHEQRCRECNGKGKIHYDSVKCKECKGTGFRGSEVYSLTITNYDDKLNKARTID